MKSLLGNMTLLKQDIRPSYAAHVSKTLERNGSGVPAITKITPLWKLKIFWKLGAKQRTFSLGLQPPQPFYHHLGLKFMCISLRVITVQTAAPIARAARRGNIRAKFPSREHKIVVTAYKRTDGGMRRREKEIHRSRVHGETENVKELASTHQRNLLAASR